MKIKRVGRILEDGSVEGNISTEMYSVRKQEMKKQEIINALLKEPLTERGLWRKVGHKFDNRQDLNEQVNTLEKGNLIEGVRVTGKVGAPSTVYHFVQGRVIPPEKPPEKPLKPPEPTPTIIESPEFLDLIEDIKRLKKDPDRTERDHEARVESFYKLLGYSNEEILFRRGSVDISIMLPNEQMIVNEVKRDWGLTRKDMKALKQAYGYAGERGARLVVVTNCDYPL